MKNDKINFTGGELEKYIRNVDKAAVEARLREMGMADIAERLRQTDSEEIIRMLGANPDVIKKINQIMGGK